jgi:hypothetical protein
MTVDAVDALDNLLILFLKLCKFEFADVVSVLILFCGKFESVLHVFVIGEVDCGFYVSYVVAVAFVIATEDYYFADFLVVVAGAVSSHNSFIIVTNYIKHLTNIQSIFILFIVLCRQWILPH